MFKPHPEQATEGSASKDKLPPVDAPADTRLLAFRRELDRLADRLGIAVNGHALTENATDEAAGGDDDHFLAMRVRHVPRRWPGTGSQDQVREHLALLAVSDGLKLTHGMAEADQAAGAAFVQRAARIAGLDGVSVTIGDAPPETVPEGETLQ